MRFLEPALNNRSFRAFALALLIWHQLVSSAPLDARDDNAVYSAVSGARHEFAETRIVSVGLFGPESVFESEAVKAAQILRRWFGATSEPIVRSNRKRGGTANAQSLATSIRAAGATMDPDRNVLVVFLTSHGSPEGLAIVAGRRRGVLTPIALRHMLDASGAKFRIVIISACYSGVFVPVLADARTLVITAAAADRPSFGCEDGATWTYFGDAFFNQALRAAPDLRAAFRRARALVSAREKREGFEPSKPQMVGGADVLTLLAADRNTD